jgi:LysM repeat protein
MPRTRLIFAAILFGVLLTPALAFAQGEQRTHTVKRGDTLWDLAELYLGDPFRWPEIYRRNQTSVQDPNLIYPEQVLVISGDVAATPGTPAESPTPVDTAMQTPPEPMPEPEPEPAPVVPTEPPGMTIFNPERYRTVRGERQSLVVRAPAAAVRSGDYLQAPFLWEMGGISGAGRVDATSQADGIGLTLTQRPIQIFENVYVQIPTGAQGAPDERFILFRYGPAIQGRGRVVIPTGVVKLTSAAVNGRAAALLLTKFEDVYSGQGLMMLDTLTLEPGTFPTRVEFGTATTLAYLYGDPVLPPVGHQLIFAAGSGDGLVPGNQLTIEIDMGLDERGVPLPPQEIATATVTRVTAWGASAILIGQKDGGIRTGLTARVTAKMP